MLAKLAQFLELMLYVLVAGVMWGTWLSLGRTMTQYDAATFLADGKHMIANLGAVDGGPHDRRDRGRAPGCRAAVPLPVHDRGLAGAGRPAARWWRSWW